MLTIAAITIGVHLATAHFNAVPNDAPSAYELHATTPGVYVRFSNGVTAGALRNSLGRPSVYAGWTTPKGMLGPLPIDLTLGAITGYKYELVTGERACPQSYKKEHEHGGHAETWMTTCTFQYGNTTHAVRPMFALSYALPVEVAGVRPRLSLMPRALSISVEKEF